MTTYVDLSKDKSFEFVEQRGSTKIFNIIEYPRTYEVNGIQIHTNSAQLALRNIVNITKRRTVNPWCFIQNNLCPANFNYKNLSIDALYWWKMYSFEQKKIAIRHGKIYALYAIPKNGKFVFMKNNGYTTEQQFNEHKSEFYSFIMPWWSIYNKQYCDIDSLGNLI